MQKTIDLNEHLIPIQEVPREVPTRPHIATVWRWVKRGCRGQKLATILVGGRRFTSRKAIQRFIDATTGVDRTTVSSPSQRKAVQRANAELDQAKI